MREIRTGIEIDAPPRAVWETLADAESYGEWNPHITRASGDLRVGSGLEITVERIDDIPRTMTVRVSKLDPPRRLQWVGTVGSKRPFRGRHTFDLDAAPVEVDVGRKPDGTCTTSSGTGRHVHHESVNRAFRGQ